MTTVINFNILNFFRLKLDSHTVNDVRINNYVSDRKKEASEGYGRVIDVTPCREPFKSGRELMVRVTPLLESKVLPARLAMEPAPVDIAYDRSGKAVRIYESKGMHIDAYV